MKIIRNFLLLLSLFLMNLLVGNRLNAQNSTSKEDFHKHISYFFEFDDWASTNLPYISERFIGNVKQIYFDDYYLDIIGDTISEEQQKYYESIKEEFKASFLDTVYLRGKAFKAQMTSFLEEIGEFDSQKVTVHFDFSKENKHSEQYIKQKESLYLGTFPVMNKIVIHYGDSHQIILKRIHLYANKIYFEEAEVK